MTDNVRTPWAKAYYEAYTARGGRHQAALSALAVKWIRILFRCWKERVPYDESRYLAALQKSGLGHRLATELLESVEGPEDPEWAETWAAELDRRVRELDEGRVRGGPWSEVKAKIEARLRSK